LKRSIEGKFSSWAPCLVKALNSLQAYNIFNACRHTVGFIWCAKCFTKLGGKKWLHILVFLGKQFSQILEKNNSLHFTSDSGFDKIFFKFLKFWDWFKKQSLVSCAH
jgi:hypothetical protein